jgi:nucleotide-binding universal stress UspA family protein
MKSILVPTDQTPAMASVLETTRLVADKFGSTVSGVALRPVHVEIVAPDPIVAVTFPPADWDDSEFGIKARKVFDEFATRAGADVGQKFRWRGGQSIDDAVLGSLARVYDVVVLGRPVASGAGPRMTSLEAVLFESGRPVILAPPKAPTTLGKNIVVSWNCSTEQARATADALPLLKLAEQVTVIFVEGLVVPGPSAAQCVEYLAAHDIKAREVSLPLNGKKAGDVLLAEAGRIGADLIVKGAYTQSRLRQMIFGGATSYLLAHSDIPLLMAR